MTNQEFNDNYRILFQAGTDESYVTVVKKFNNELKKYVIPHEGKQIAIDSDEYYQIPKWVEEKVNPQIIIDFNIENDRK